MLAIWGDLDLINYIFDYSFFSNINFLNYTIFLFVHNFEGCAKYSNVYNTNLYFSRQKMTVLAKKN